MQSIEDDVLRQSTYDFLRNTQFRPDYWVRSPQEMNRKERTNYKNTQQYILTAQIPEKMPSFTFKEPGNAVSEEVFTAIFAIMADYKPHTLAELESELQSKGIKAPQIHRGIMLLMSGQTVSYLKMVQSGMNATLCEQTKKLNAFCYNMSSQSNDMSFLASPVTGGGIAVPRSDQLFLESIEAGGQTPAEWAQHAWQQFSAHKQKIVTEAGQRLETEEESKAELQARAKLFSDKRLPILKALGIARIA